MNNKVRSLTRTAALLALLIVLQWATRPLGQLATGSCVNAVLALSALLVGAGCSIAIALLSPLFAFLLGIAPQALTVPAIMAGNLVFVLLLRPAGSPSFRPLARIGMLVLAATAKFLTLYLLVVKVFCGLLAQDLLGLGLLQEPLLGKLPAMFSFPQLITALIGGALALLIVPALKKALGKPAGAAQN